MKKLSLDSIEKTLFSLLILFLPTQLGKHFWPEFSIVNGIRIDYLSPTIYVTDVIICLLFFVVITQHLYHKQFSLPRINVPLSAFLLFLVINSSLSQAPLNGLYSLVKFLEYTFLFFYIKASVPKVLSLQLLTTLFAIGVIVEALIAFGQFVNQGSLGGMLYFLGERYFTASTPGIANASLNGELILRAYGTFPHPNVLAGYLVISMVLIFFYLYPTKQPWFRILATSALLIGSGALLLTLSRVAILLWLLFLTTVFGWQLFQTKGMHERTFVYLKWVLVFLASLILFANILVPRFAASSFSEEAFVQRQQLTKVTLEMVLERPVMGVGLGNFLPVLSAHHSPSSVGFYLQPVHNIFLLVLAETGIIGLVFFVWFLGKSFQRNVPLFLCLSVIALTGLLDHYWLTLQQSQLVFVVILGLVWKNTFQSFHLGKAKNIRR